MDSWKNLPLSVLLEIFLCLDMESRRNTSLTCKAWADAFKHPQFWKFLSLEFSDKECPFVCCQEEMIYTVVSHCYQTLKHLIVTWDQIELKLGEERFVVMLTDFFNSLIRNCNLLQLKTLSLEAYIITSPGHFITSEKVNSLVISLARFLRSQNSLEELFILWELDIIHQALLVDAVTCCSAKNLKLLDVYTGSIFFPNNSYPSVFQMSLKQFSNLERLYLSYENLGANTLDSVSNHCKNLSYLRLEVTGSYLEHVHGKPHLISYEKWKEVKEKLPDLVVAFVMNIPSSGYWPWELDLFQRLLPSIVPLRSFISRETKFQKECIAYLQDFAESIRYMELYCVQEVIPSAFSVIPRLSQLRRLKLIGPFPVETIDFLQQFKLQQMKKLRVVYLLFDTLLMIDEVKARRNSVNKELKWIFKIIVRTEHIEYEEAFRCRLPSLTNIGL